MLKIYLKPIITYVLAASFLLVATASSCFSQPYCKVRTFTIDDGLPANNISEFGLSDDGMMWVSTWNGLCNYDGYKFSRFREHFGAGQVLTSNRLKFIRPNSCGDIWCSTYDGKAYLFDCTTCRYIDLDVLVGNKVRHKFPVRNIISLPNGHAWVLGDGNINLRIDEGKIKNHGGVSLIDTRKTIYRGPIRKVMADGNGREWVFADNGVGLYGSKVLLPFKFEYMCHVGRKVYFASRDGRFGVYSDRLRMISVPAPVTKINGMCSFGSDKLALACDKGLLVFSTRTSGFRLVSVQHPSQPSADVKKVFTDSRGRAWAFSSGPGVSLVSPDGSSVRWLQSEADGWMGTTSRYPVFHEDDNHTVWVIPNGGVFSYYDEARGCLVPYNLNAENSNRLPVSYILKYKKDAQNNPVSGRAADNANVLEIPAGERNAIVYFSALDYDGNRLIRYAYRIKELDSEWSYTGMSHSASLSHIPAGKYTLVVKSTNSDGVWTDNARELKIYVHPTFWETGWAMLLYVLVGLSVIFSLFYVWRLRSNVAMEKRLKERQLRFFTGISHQLRTPLTLIDGPVGQVLSEEPLSAKARTYLEFVKKNSVRMLELVNKSLDLKKLDAAADDVDAAPQNSDEMAVSDNMPQSAATVSGLDFASGRITVLVVEDNVELRYFLVSSLSSSYNVFEARNGQEGLEMAQSRQPDFIITDIMMPVMDGMTMIRKIKACPDTCHIPIVVLSARTAINYRIEGLNEGIDDYITKPFSVSYLKSRVDNIIRQRRQLQQAYVSKLNAAGDGHLIYKADSPGIADADKEFARRLVDYLEPRISDPELKIDDITRAMALSRTVFYGKVKSLFGMSPIDFVRHMRILRAERLIVESRMSFSEIAYSVGFTDPKYFGRTFKAKTGMTPSDYRKKYSQRG